MMKNLKNHLIAISVLTLLSGFIIFLQFKNMNRRLYRLEQSVTHLSQEWTNLSLKAQNTQNEDTLEGSQDNQIKQLQSEYQEYEFKNQSDTGSIVQELNDDTEDHSNVKDNLENVEEVVLDENDDEMNGGDDDSEEEDNDDEDNNDKEEMTKTISLSAQAAIARQNEINLTESDIQEINNLEATQMTVNQLKDSIKSKGGTFPTKVVKADLIKIYQGL